MEPTEGAIVAGRFRLERRLGQGGMGAVWLARHLSLDIPCALKFLHAEGAEQAEARARFEREAKAAAQLRSPNVVQILDHGIWENAPYIAMELLEGEDLQQRLQRMRRLDVRDTYAILAQVCRALGKAHAAGLVHRDLKPGNIFLVRDDDREVAKVLDFGVAKNTLEVGDSKTQTGALMGTPYYMSPEQARGIREVDYRSDLWAVAVIAYQCILGRLPFPGDALGDLLMKIIAEPLPIPSQVAGQIGVPPGFDNWWMRAAARDPNHRFQSAKELIDALGVALGVSVGVVDAYASSPSGISPLAANMPPGYGRPGMTGSGQYPIVSPPSSPSYGGGPASHPTAHPNHPSYGNPHAAHPSHAGHPGPPSQAGQPGYGTPQSYSGQHGIGFAPAQSSPSYGSAPVAPPPSYGSGVPLVAPQTANPLATPISPAAPKRGIVGTAVAIGIGTVVTAGAIAAFVLSTAKPPPVAGSSVSGSTTTATAATASPTATATATATPAPVASVTAAPTVEPSSSASSASSAPAVTATSAASAPKLGPSLPPGRRPIKGPKSSSHDDGI